jgi:5-oxopent-3-ene-1,2,5-tricarboxylate decarboxylase/2-hydroxyhepta-2,4-diene-1,7-dioate isomerase
VWQCPECILDASQESYGRLNEVTYHGVIPLENISMPHDLPPQRPFWPVGTVYGTLLNFQREVDVMATQMTQPPYKAPPQAPVLYVKTANTWSPSAAPVPVPASAPCIEVGATIAIHIGPQVPVKHQLSATQKVASTVAGFVLMNDFSIPHASYFRPPVKFKCLDGFLGLGERLVTVQEAGDPALFKLEVRINGVPVQTVDFGNLVRNVATLLADVSEFMTLREGDLLMLGSDCLPGGGRPLAKVGDRVDISAPNLPQFGTLSNTLVGEAS